MGLGRRVVGAAVLAALCATLPGREAHGHGLALPFAFWGNFSPPAAHCQRLLGLAAARCGLAAIQARNACLLPLINGGACDDTAVLDQVQRAHLKELDLVDLQCTSPEAQALGFLLKFEAQTDLDTFCHAVEDAVVSGVYGPVLVDGVVLFPDPTAQRCVDAMARAATRLLQFAFRARRHALDRIASRAVDPSAKQRDVDRSTARIARLYDDLVAQIALGCPESDFAAVYGRSAATLLTAIGQRADCLAGAVYVQNAIVCPTPVCGNGLKESGEQCDDGNLANGDGCSSRCILESAP